MTALLGALVIAATLATGVIGLSAGTTAQASTTNLSQVMPFTGAFFTLEAGDDAAQATISLNPAYLGDLGRAGSVFGEEADVTSRLAVRTAGLPEQLTLSLESASVTWDAAGQRAKVVLLLEGRALPSSYDGSLTLINVVTGQSLLVPLRVNVN